MYFQQIKNLSYKNNLKKTDWARLAGVSRAAVTQWFHKGQRDGFINLETATVRKIADGCHVSPMLFMTPSADLSKYQTWYLWDYLYPHMEAFVWALAEARLPALARLVQVKGFYQAMQVIGKKAVKLFPQYKRFIKPTRRKELEILWPLYQT